MILLEYVHCPQFTYSIQFTCYRLLFSCQLILFTERDCIIILFQYYNQLIEKIPSFIMQKYYAEITTTFSHIWTSFKEDKLNDE